MDGQINIFDFPECIPEEKVKQSKEDYEWHSIDTPPEEGCYCKFEYTWSCNQKNDRTGTCDGWWHSDGISWNNMPIDIGHKEVKRWRRLVEGLKPLYDTVECNHSINHLCNRWHGSKEEIAKAKEDLLKGFACTVCCYDCSEAPMHGGRCKYECRYYGEK